MRSLNKIRPQLGGAGPSVLAIARLLPMWQALSASTQDAMLPLQLIRVPSSIPFTECEIEIMKSFEDGDRMITAAKMCEILGISKATMYRRIGDDPSFPEGVRLGKTKTKRFWLSDVMRYASGEVPDVPATNDQVVEEKATGLDSEKFDHDDDSLKSQAESVGLGQATSNVTKKLNPSRNIVRTVSIKSMPRKPVCVHNRKPHQISTVKAEKNSTGTDSDSSRVEGAQ